MTEKLINWPMKLPYIICMRPICSTAPLHEPGVPNNGEMSGMNKSLTNEFTKPVAAVAITKAIAKERILYSWRNTMNSCVNLFMGTIL